MPSCASNRPTELALNTTPNLSLISLATMSRVHNANANFSCNGFLSVTVLQTHCRARAFSLGGLPNNGLAFNAPHPPRRYCASHPYIVRRLILKDRATTSGFSPACTLRTARIRIASNVADPVCEHRLVSCHMRITPDSPCQEINETTYGPIIAATSFTSASLSARSATITWPT